SSAVAKALARAVSAAGGAFDVTDFRWFDARNADSSMSSIEAHSWPHPRRRLAQACIRSSPPITFGAAPAVRDACWLAIARSAAAFRTRLVAWTREGAYSM